MKTNQNVLFPYPNPSQNFADGISAIPYQLPEQMLRKTLFTFVIALCFVCIAAMLPQETCAQEQQGRDILEFLGAMSDEQAKKLVVGENSFLIALKRRTNTTFDDNTPQNYYLLLKDVSPLEKQILSDAANGRWNRFDLLQASLIAEGVHDFAKIKTYETRLNKLSEQICEKAKSRNLSREDRTKLAFETLHKDVLTGAYNIEHTNPAISFEKGTYNCVSATILFNVLAQKSGIDVCGLEMAGHVCSRVKYDSQFSNVETTCATWFSLQKPSERRLAIQNRIAPAPKSNGTQQNLAKPLDANGNKARTDELADVKKVREISDVQLVAAVYYNQGHDQWLANRLPESAVATAKALFLDPENENAWGNLIGAINNIALGFSMEQKRHDIAAGLMDQIALLDPNFKDLQSNQFHIYSTWIKELIAAGQVNDAKIVFDYANERLSQEQRMKQLANLINSAARNR